MNSIPDSEIPNLNVGDIYYECQYGLNIKCEVLTKPVEDVGVEGKRKWSWEAKNVFDGRKIDYTVTEGFSYLGPRLYTEPQYVHIIDGQFVYKFVGEES